MHELAASQLLSARRPAAVRSRRLLVPLTVRSRPRLIPGRRSPLTAAAVSQGGRAALSVAANAATRPSAREEVVAARQLYVESPDRLRIRFWA
jgi:hypothetical protein